MGIIKGLGFLVFFTCYFLHVFASQQHLVSAFVQENGMVTRKPNQKQFTREEGKSVVSVNKISSGRGGGFGGSRGGVIGGGGSGGFRGGNGGAGKPYGGGDAQSGGTTSKSPYTPGTTAVIPVYTAAGAANRRNNQHSGASGPKYSQVGFGITAVKVAILAPLVLMLGSFCL